MAKNEIKTAEFVSPKHPDKICDIIADSILDAYLAGDPETRAAIEVMGGHGLITINGEVTSKSEPDVKKIVRDIVGENFEANIKLVAQSGEIAKGVDLGGAGDQGVMRGYATNETQNFMPLEYELARNLCMKIFESFPYDGKTQVTLVDGKVKTVVASFQNTNSAELLQIVKKIMADLTSEALAKEVEYLINPAGPWSQGGFDADTGLSGRKIIVDGYGPEVRVGGGSFSGKDYTKVDRSGAYMARKIAVDYLRKFSAEAVEVKLAYAIGRAEPVMAVAVVNGEEKEITGYDLSPRGIRKFLNLDKVKFTETAGWGHFGRGFAWDR